MPHIHEKIDFTVEVFVVYEDRVLLRKHDKFNFWLSVGGHIELDEDSNEAAIREVKEEVGLDVELYCPEYVELFVSPNYKELIPPLFMNRHRITDTHEHVTLVYGARSSTDELVLCEKEKSSGCKWFSLEELEKNEEEIKESVRQNAMSILKLLSSRHP